MLVKVTDSLPEKYSIQKLRADNPNVSFPTDPTEATLAEWGVFTLHAGVQPVVDHTKNITEGQPQLIDGKWTQTWVTSDATAQEITERLERQSASVRDSRQVLLSASDWTQLPDAPLTDAKRQAWSTYRQALRDITAQAGFPWNVTWPTMES